MRGLGLFFMRRSSGVLSIGCWRWMRKSWFGVERFGSRSRLIIFFILRVCYCYRSGIRIFWVWSIFLWCRLIFLFF